MARSFLFSLAAVCLLVAFTATGCKPKADVNVGNPTITPPAPTAPTADVGKLPPDTGTPANPVGVLPPVTPSADPVVPAGARTHVMAKGDTIFGLGGKYYGAKSNANVKKIMDANPQYKDPTKIPVGAKIVIP
ncbi:MAG: LysM peptidoglycan-binding domain-containing protein [Phycisphaerae bacterium]|nr:LysM peptidoglycan-binding domain-containing protein [Phycisphaerae bacterium]